MREKSLILLKQGKSLGVRLRKYRAGDEAGMIACIRDEYGDTYFKRGFYDPEYLKQEAEEGRITFLVAETEGREIAGMLILKDFLPEETMCEIASQIFRRKYRGYGLAMPFFEYGMKILLSKSHSAAFCLPVVFHDTTQRLLYRLGLRGTGFVLNVFDMEEVTHSYPGDRNAKHSQGIQVRALEKRDAGTLYIPGEHRGFAEEIYGRLGVKYCMAAEPPEGSFPPEKSSITWKNDGVQHSLEIRIHRIGRDLIPRIRQLHTRFPLRGKQTAGIFLTCSDPYAPWAYERLRRQGYFFTGLKPLCSEREYMVLHHPGEVRIYMEDYVLSREFKYLAEYVQTCYRKRDSDGKEEDT